MICNWSACWYVAGVRFFCVFIWQKQTAKYKHSHIATRNSSEDEIANVNSLYDDGRHRTRTTKYNRLVHKFRQRWTRLCVGMQVYQNQWNNAMQRPLRRSRSFKVTDCGTNRKLIYDLPLVINTNYLPLSCTVSKLRLIIGHIIVLTACFWRNKDAYIFSLASGECLTLTLSRGWAPANIAINDISLKLL